MTAVMEECAVQSAFLSQERTGIKSDKGGKYMKKTGISVQQLFEETDAQKILSQSNYRPK